jgi:hypothetical protein
LEEQEMLSISSYLIWVPQSLATESISGKFANFFFDRTDVCLNNQSLKMIRKEQSPARPHPQIVQKDEGDLE